MIFRQDARSTFAEGGQWSHAVDPKRVERFMARHARLA